MPPAGFSLGASDLCTYKIRSENSALLKYKEKAHRELCWVRDEQKTIEKINTDL